MAEPKAVSGFEAARSLAQRLVPIADRIRQSVAVGLGVRPYRVFLVTTRWTGEERGLGREDVAEAREILPAPRVELLTNVQDLPFPAGTLERGVLQIDRISGEFSEGELSGADADRKRESFFWEVVEDGRVGELVTRRRCRFLGAHRRADRADWLVYVERMDEDRTVAGVPGSRPGVP